MPQRKNSKMERQYTFSCDQRRAMARRIAGVFGTEGGTILLRSDRDNWRKDLVRLLAKRARPIRGSNWRSGAHQALVAQVVDALFTDHVVSFTNVGARMSPKYMEKQAGISRMLRVRDKDKPTIRRASPYKRSRQVAAA